MFEEVTMAWGAVLGGNRGLTKKAFGVVGCVVTGLATPVMGAPPNGLETEVLDVMAPLKRCLGSGDFKMAKFLILNKSSGVRSMAASLNVGDEPKCYCTAGECRRGPESRRQVNTT